MASEVHVPIRQCRICRTRAPKSNLTRWVRAATGWIEDPVKHIEGRGMYTCSPACTAKLMSGKKK